MFGSKKNKDTSGRVVANNIIKTKEGKRVFVQTIKPPKRIKPAK